MDRPDYMHCIGDIHKKSYCEGKDLSWEWHFLDIEHAISNFNGGGRLVACPDCVVEMMHILVQLEQLGYGCLKEDSNV